tara:strand:+ start:1534 stop:1764 length:231 start_codon:yes stop_codon:yes gene_type:complete
MSQEKENNICSKNNCYAVTALCVSFLVLGLVIGNWMGKCTAKSKKCNKSKKCQSYSVDGKAGSTCTWPKANGDTEK